MCRCLNMVLMTAFLMLMIGLMLSACRHDSPSAPHLTTPANVEIKIDQDSAATRDTVLRVSISADNTHRMLISLDSTFSSTEWEDFDTLKILYAPHQEGLVFVYGRFATAGGGTTGVIHDEIELDFTAKITSVTAEANSNTLRPGNVVEFTLDAGEDGRAFISFTSIRLKYEIDYIGDGIFKGFLDIPTGINEDRVITIGYFTDAVGNVAEPVTAEEEYVIRGPELILRVIKNSPLEGVLGHDVWLSQGFCFVCDTNSVHLVDIRDPFDPLWTGSIATGAWSSYFVGSPARLFVPHRYGLAVVSIQPPDQAYVMGNARLNEICRDVAIDDFFAYVSCKSCKLVILDIHSFVDPVLVSKLVLDGFGERISLNEKTVYIVGGEFGFIVDVSIAKNPVHLATFRFRNEPSDIVFSEGYLYISSVIEGIIVVDVRDPYNPLIIAQHRDFAPAYSLELSLPFLYIGGNDNIKVVNATRPMELGEITRVDGLGIVHSMFASDDYLFVSQPEMLTIIRPLSQE
ncbi:MAG: hypothetical protein P9X24_06735 [Candidatus Hatepunaea meridiana]|nr:hypothetical protein [Candidatus Hatepunaea meridiana]